MIASAQVDSPFNFHFFENNKISNPLITLRDVQLGYQDQPVLSKVGFSLNPNDRIGLLGVNGAGKSTLIKGLTGDITPQSGEITRGEHCKIGYFAQHQLEALDLNASALLHIQRLDSKASEQQIRNFLGGFDFQGDKALEPIAPFSGGEKARLALALIVWQKPNVLLLDEPTNHLDLDMRSALTLALQEFTGALVVVSHDRHLLRHSVDHYLFADEGLIQPFEGTLDDYHQWINKKTARQKAPAKAQKSQKNQEGGDKKSPQKKHLSQTERKERSSVQNRIRRIEEKMRKANEQLNKVEESLADNRLYDADKKDQLTELIHQQKEQQQTLDALEESWLELNERLEEIES